MKSGSNREKELIAELEALRMRISKLEKVRGSLLASKSVGKSSRMPRECIPVVEYVVTLPLDAVL